MVVLCVLNNSNENRTDKIIKSEKISWVKTNKRPNKKMETKRKLSYTLPIKRTRTGERVSSSCFNMFGIASRDNVLPFSFLALSSVLLWVPYVALENTVRVFFRFYHTDWLTAFCSCFTILFIRLVVALIYILLRSGIFDCSKCFLCLFFHVRTYHTEHRNPHDDEHVRGIFGQRNLCSYSETVSTYFRLCPFLNILFLLCVALTHTRSFLLVYQKWWHWRSHNGEKRQKREREENRQKHGEMS